MRRRLADEQRPNRVHLMLRIGTSPPDALHQTSRPRSFSWLRSWRTWAPGGTCTLLTVRLSRRTPPAEAGSWEWVRPACAGLRRGKASGANPPWHCAGASDWRLRNRRPKAPRRRGGPTPRIRLQPAVCASKGAPSGRAFKDRVGELTRRTSGVSLDTVIKRLTPVLRGWWNYFRFSEAWVFRWLDGWVRGRLRAIALRHEKRPGRRPCGEIHRRYPNARLAALGLFSMAGAPAAVR